MVAALLLLGGDECGTSVADSLVGGGLWLL
jgi:hypothetical protein